MTPGRGKDKGFAERAYESGWRDLVRAGIITEAGNAKHYETGDWRAIRPVWDKDKCSHCLFCWVYCPDNAIMVEDGKVVGIDYRYCKGCGICAQECPAKVRVIEMAPETEAD